MSGISRGFVRKAPPGCGLPALITPARPGEDLCALPAASRQRIEAALAEAGGVLLRGFDVPGVDDFHRFASSFGHPLLKYEFGSTPRTEVSASAGAGIYTSTEYPAHQVIPLHNEQSYAREWPMKIWFHCITPAQQGGETPIADSRAVYAGIPARIRQRFEAGILYVRNYGSMDVPWQNVFNTTERPAVESYCRQVGIRWEWKEDDGLRTAQVCQAVATHPVSGVPLWFNQAHLFHISARHPDEREVLEALYGIEGLPRNTYYADGSTIEDEVLDEVRAAFDSQTVVFEWRAGDVMMLDNMLVAHGRGTFSGPRKVVVAMAQAHGEAPSSVGRP